MLSMEQIRIIVEQLSSDNSKEFVENLILTYASDANRIEDLLMLIPRLASKQVKIKEEQIAQKDFAIDLLLSDVYRSVHSMKYKKSDNSIFPGMLHVCRAHFPKGNCEGGSIADKDYFNRFIEYLKNKRTFDYEDPSAWGWIINIVHCKDWLVSVIHQNIDPDFDIDKLLSGGN